MTKITLTNYIENIVAEYKMETTCDYFKQFCKAFTRRLKKKNLWETDSFDENGKKLFDINELDKIKVALHDYLNDNIEEFVYIRDQNEFYNIYNQVKDKEKNFRESESRMYAIVERNVTPSMEKDLMLKAIYNMFFEDIDKEQWSKDNNVVEDYRRDVRRAKEYHHEHREMNDEEKAAYERKQNPVESYCKRKR